MPHADQQIDYLEFPATDLTATKAFYSTVFGWVFTDWGPDYASFARGEAGLDGGFDRTARPGAGVLVIFYADDLEATLDKVKAAGAEIVKPIFAFPGGRRFHFKDPNGNELAVWAD